MRITNDLGLPLPLVEAVRNDGYSKGECDFSTTELIGPPRIAQLKKKWDGSMSEDASDRIFALLGKSIHSILEHSADAKRYLIEKRFFGELDGHRIGGQIDLFDLKESVLQDWKVTSRHTTNDAKRKYLWSSLRTAPEGKGWIEQANVNAYLMFLNGYRVDTIQYVAIYRDWSKMQVSRSHDYPPRQVEVLTIPRWKHIQTEDYLRDRIKVHVEARSVLPMCTPEERWERPTMYAVMKPGAKRATKLFEFETEAVDHAAALTATNGKGKPYFIETRSGESVRCLNYCEVAGYCSFGQKLLQEQLEHEQP